MLFAMNVLGNAVNKTKSKKIAVYIVLLSIYLKNLA
jgi:hypothetical protein